MTKNDVRERSTEAQKETLTKKYKGTSAEVFLERNKSSRIGKVPFSVIVTDTGEKFFFSENHGRSKSKKIKVSAPRNDFQCEHDH